jgi:hypothetical protein
MAARFWVGGTGTWDAADTTHWAASTGGAGGQSVPGTSDAVTIDASSGAGTITVATNVAVQAITCGAMGMTLDFATNNNTVTLTASPGFSGTGTGARTINGGTGQWTISNGGGTVFSMATSTNLTNPTTAFASTPIAFTNTASGATAISLGSLTYGTITRSATVRGTNIIHAGATISSLSIAAPNYVLFTNSQTATIATLAVTGGSSSAIVGLTSDSADTQATISLTNSPTLTWVSSRAIVYSGAGSSFTATNSFDLGRGSGATFSVPSGGGLIRHPGMSGGLNG